jgi:hypothetical protein
MNADNLNNVICETSRIFRNKKMEYQKDKIELESNRKNRNVTDLCRGINEFKNGYQPNANLVKDKNGDLLVEFYSILNSRENCVPAIECT